MEDKQVTRLTRLTQLRQMRHAALPTESDAFAAFTYKGNATRHAGASFVMEPMAVYRPHRNPPESAPEVGPAHPAQFCPFFSTLRMWETWSAKETGTIAIA